MVTSKNCHYELHELFRQNVNEYNVEVSKYKRIIDYIGENGDV